MDQNADYHSGQGVRPTWPWLHLQAMDFADHSAPHRFGLWKRLFLMGSAETVLGNYESALEHLLAARA